MTIQKRQSTGALQNLAAEEVGSLGTAAQPNESDSSRITDSIEKALGSASTAMHWPQYHLAASDRTEAFLRRTMLLPWPI